MIALITNTYKNNNIINYEVRTKELEKIFLRSTNQNIILKIGDFVQIEKITGKTSIKEKVNRPDNYWDYFPKSKMDYNELYTNLNSYIEQIKDDEFRLILEETVLTNLDFFKYPAAKTIHHAYIGGLCEHTLNILKLSESYISLYNLDKDILWCAIILHDYAKIYELKDYGLTYSIEGNLIGHLVIAVEEIIRIQVKYNMKNNIKFTTLKHLILAHHGKLDYGSPKEPMTKEAYVLSMLDEVDAKMNLLNNILNNLEDNEMSLAINGFDKRRFFNYQKKN